MIRVLGALLTAAGLGIGGWAIAQLMLQYKRGQSALETYYSIATEHLPVPVGSWEHRVRVAFGEKAAGREQAVYWGASVAVGLALAIGLILAQIPLLYAVPLGLLGGWLTINTWLNTKWLQIVRAIEHELPTFLRTLGSVLAVTPNVTEALEEATASLEVHGPLWKWMQRFAHELRINRHAAFETMKQEAGRLSPHLLFTVVEIQRLWETGGQQFAHAFRQAAEDQARLMRARNEAQAEIDGARSTLRVILLSLGGAVYFSIRMNPQPYTTLWGKMGLAGVAALAAVGWWLLQSMMREVLE